jgi:methyl-accepting chemotaxis protein
MTDARPSLLSNLDALPFATLCVARDGRVSGWNRAATKLTGFGKYTAVGKQAWAFLDGKGVDPFASSAEGDLEPVAVTLRDTDGNKRELLLHVARVDEPSDEVVFVASLVPPAPAAPAEPAAAAPAPPPGLATLAERAAQLAAQIAEGNLKAKIDLEGLDELPRAIAESVGSAVTLLADTLNETRRVMEGAAVGDMAVRFTTKRGGDVGMLQAAVRAATQVTQKLLVEVAMLVESAKTGKMDVRIQTGKFEGAYRELCDAINEMLGALVAPVREGTSVLTRIAAGDLSARVEGEYLGDHAVLRDSVNGTIDTIRGLIEEVEALSRSARDGKLDVRVDADAFRGDFQRLVAGLNAAIDTILAPIEESFAVLEKMADGDLRAKVRGDYRGEHRRIQQSLNRTLDMLNESLGEVARAAVGLRDSSRQISESANNLSRGANEQASTLEEISGQMSTMTEQTRKTSHNAQAARELSQTARDGAREGDTKMKRMVEAMKEIDQASQNISRVNKVIDEIAFQTNLLALNAAVEAARAGQHGKGFAVVAEEVRNLAARSATAAKETASMIESTIGKINLGMELAEETAEALTRIVSNSDQVTDLVGGIAVASDEQARGISEVNQGLAAVNLVTQQNAATAEESANAARELAGQSAHLQEKFSRFSLLEARKPEFDLSSLPPELLAVLQPFLGGKGPVQPGTSSAANTRPMRAAAGLNPESVISLDDDFDRY